MTIEQALQDLGVRPDLLSAAEKQQLDEKGYLILEGILSPQEVQDHRAMLDHLTEIEGEDAGKEQHREEGADRVADLVNKGPLYDRCYIEPRVLAAVTHVLGTDIKLFAFSSRAAQPGTGRQALHKDGFTQPENPLDFNICNTIWPLDDFTAQNGATRIVPGSHLVQGLPEEVKADPLAPHPDEIQVIAPAGSVVVFNSHLLHGGTQNFTETPRRAMFSAYCLRHMQQLTDQREYFRPETAARISEAAKVLLDVA